MKKFENFRQAFQNLGDIFQYQEPYGNVELTGLVGLFEICFEQAWKAMKEILEQNGFSPAQTGSPRMILKTAFQAGMIQDEELWLKALADRNLVSHSYHKEIALSIIQNTKDDYYKIFKDLVQSIEANWM